MKKKDFFTIIVKLFGLYLFVTTLFNIIPSSLQYWASESEWFFRLIPLAAIFLAVSLVTLFLFYAHIVTTFLKLDKGFEDEEINFGSLDAEKILHLGLIIVGGLMFLDNLPLLLTNGYLALKDSVQTTFDATGTPFGTQLDYAYLWSSGLSVLSGYLILTNYRWLATWLLSRNELTGKPKI